MLCDPGSTTERDLLYIVAGTSPPGYATVWKNYI
jgi:hypothetical protein